MVGITDRERDLTRARRAAWFVLNERERLGHRRREHARVHTALLVGSVRSFLFRGVLFTSILHGSRYNFYWLPHVDNIRFEHSDEMNCNICRLNWRAYFRADGSIDWKANNEHFRGGGGRGGGRGRRRMIDWYSFLILEFSAVIQNPTPCSRGAE